MSAPTSNSPGQLEVINLAIERFMGEVHTMQPGKIVDYDHATQTATVQPSLKRKYVGVEAQLLPQLKNVPVIFPSFKTGWLRFPLAVGDTVMLLFSERSLDVWWTNGGEVDPQIPHKFHLSDAVAVPGLNPSTAPIVPKGASTSVELAFGTAWLEITAAGQFKIKNSFAELFSALQQFAATSASATTAPQIAAAAATLLTAITFLMAP